MPRSYFFIALGDLEIYKKEELYEADAVVIDIYDVNFIYNNFDIFKIYFDKMKKLNIDIYMKLDTRNLKKCYQALKNTFGSYLSGWVIPHAEPKLLNRLMMKVREYEQNHKLDFGSLNFIAVIDTPEGIINYRKIALYERVKCLHIDEDGYRQYLGFDNITTYLRTQIAVPTLISKKPLIDSYVKDNLLADLEEGKKYGAIAKATKDLKQIKIINDFFYPKLEEISEAKEIIQLYQTTPKKERKYFAYNQQEISPLKVLRCQNILNRAKYLDLIDENINTNLIVKAEEVREKVIQKPYKKFYTLGEEIANSITHGVGIICAITFFVLLMFKAWGNPKEIIAYSVYSFGAFALYLASTLYHGLPLGSNAKRLFRKFDHMTIYLLIAGTYTPFTLLVLEESFGLIIFAILWTGAFTGLIMNLFWFGKFKYFHIALYLILGWVAIFFINSVIQSLGLHGALFLLAGGIAYTLGIIFYGLKLFKFTHMVWHIFVILGTILHFITIYFYL